MSFTSQIQNDPNVIQGLVVEIYRLFAEIYEILLPVLQYMISRSTYFVGDCQQCLVRLLVLSIKSQTTDKKSCESWTCVR